MGLETAAIVGIASAVAATGIGVASSISSAKAQKNATDSANATNIQLAREQMAYQTSERLAAQEYNTPANQRARYEQAGVNPYLMLGQMDSGNTTMQTGVTPAQVQPNYALSDLLKGLGRTGSDLMSNLQNIQQIQGQQEVIRQARVETLFKGREKLLQMNNLAADISVKMSQVDKNSQEYRNLQAQYNQIKNDIKSQEIDLKYQDDYNQARNSRERNNADLAYYQSIAVQRQSEYQEMVNDAFPSLNAAQLESLKAATSSSYAQANLSYRMSDTEIEKKAGQITANQIEALRRDNVLVEQKDAHRLAQANKIYIQAMTSKVRNSNNWVQNYSPLAGFAAAALK